LASPAKATQDDLLHVSVAFGVGLNTAQPGNEVNHHVIPEAIKVKQGGVVHFVVSGFHQIFVYRPGTTPEDIFAAIQALPDPPPTFINYLNNLWYQGLNPAGGPAGTPATTNPSNASNRVESVYFEDPGTYLVICNVRGHFLDGMLAYVTVLP
jgi:plastocyanin